MSLILRLQILKGTVATNSFKHLFPKRYVPFSITISETIIHIIISSFFVGTLKSCLPPATNSHPLQVTCLNISPQLFGFYFLCLILMWHVSQQKALNHQTPHFVNFPSAGWWYLDSLSQNVWWERLWSTGLSKSRSNCTHALANLWRRTGH